jgi:hypothetical protein
MIFPSKIYLVFRFQRLNIIIIIIIIIIIVEKGHWGDQDVDGRIILRWIFRKLGGGVVGTGWS